MAEDDVLMNTGTAAGTAVRPDEVLVDTATAAAVEPDEVLDDTGTDTDTGSDELNILTEEEMLFAGLELLGWDRNRITRVQEVTNHERFDGAFGALPHVVARIWEELQTTEIEEARINPRKHTVRYYLLSLHFLYRYPTEIEKCNLWKSCRNTNRAWSWFWVDKIRALKIGLFQWPEDNFRDLKWVVSVDGTHFRVEEPSGGELSKDPSYYSFKHHSAGFNYEIALSLTESKIVWFSGPWEAGDWNDVKIFTAHGLAYLLQKHNKMAIADNGYRGYPEVASTPNSLDDEDVAHFKSRARCRQEALNGLLKHFECLAGRFRHGKVQLQKCFEAVAVIVQFKMDGGQPLYEV